jgi:uroporphyrinogen-III decarboxylase
MKVGPMSGRERLLAAFRHERTDRIPWSPLICGYYTLGLPEPLEGDDIATQRAIGCDILERYAITCRPHIPLGVPKTSLWQIKNETTNFENIEIKTAWKNDHFIRSFRTPIGTLQDVFRIDNTSPWMMFPVEHKIKTLDDVRIYSYLVDTQQYYSTYDRYLEVSQDIGDEGLAATIAPITPFESLLEVEVGVSNFYYLLNDHPEEIVDLMDLMHRKNLDACEVVARSPAEVVIIYENTSSSNMSPSMFPQYILGYLNDYADVFHQAGKWLLVHMCGKLKAIASDIAEGKYDGIVDIAPSPTGDLDLAQAKEIFGERMVVLGGIDATTFASFEPEALKEHVWNVLDRLPSTEGVVLGSGDAVPLGTPIENLKAVTEAVEEYALN